MGRVALAQKALTEVHQQVIAASALWSIDMRAHIVENGKVVNTIEVESLDFMPGLVEATEGGIGWDYIDGQFMDNRPAPIVEPIPIADVPTKQELLAQLQALQAQIAALQ